MASPLAAPLIIYLCLLPLLLVSAGDLTFVTRSTGALEHDFDYTFLGSPSAQLLIVRDTSPMSPWAEGHHVTQFDIERPWRTDDDIDLEILARVRVTGQWEWVAWGTGVPLRLAPEVTTTDDFERVRVHLATNGTLTFHPGHDTSTNRCGDKYGPHALYNANDGYMHAIAFPLRGRCRTTRAYQLGSFIIPWLR